MTKKITLSQGIQRGENRLTEITVRKPLTKQLRGTSLVELMRLNADEWQLVLPRITVPKLEKADFARMPVADFALLSSTAFELMMEDAKDDADEADEEASEGKHEVSLEA